MHSCDTVYWTRRRWDEAELTSLNRVGRIVCGWRKEKRTSRAAWMSPRLEFQLRRCRPVSAASSRSDGESSFSEKLRSDQERPTLSSNWKVILAGVVESWESHANPTGRCFRGELARAREEGAMEMQDRTARRSARSALPSTGRQADNFWQWRSNKNRLW